MTADNDSDSDNDSSRGSDNDSDSDSDSDTATATRKILGWKRHILIHNCVRTSCMCTVPAPSTDPCVSPAK